MAEQEDPTAPTAPRRSRRKLFLISGAAALLVLAGGGAAAYFSGLLPAGGDRERGEHPPEVAGRKPDAIYVPIDPPFTVNLQAGPSTRYLQTTIELLTRDPAVEAAVKRHLPIVRDQLVMLLSRKDAQELATPDGREQLRAEALGAVQQTIQGETGLTGIEQIFFTSFVMQ